EPNSAAREVVRADLVPLIGRHLQIDPRVVGELSPHHSQDGDRHPRDDHRHSALGGRPPSARASEHRFDTAHLFGVSFHQYLWNSVFSSTRACVVYFISLPFSSLATMVIRT